MATTDLGSDSDIEPSSDLEPANVTSSGQRSLLDVLKPASKSDLSRKEE